MPAKPSLKALLPGFAWDLRMAGGRYRTIDAAGKLGKLVARNDIVKLAQDLSDASGETVANLAADAVNGAILPGDFQLAMQNELRNLYNATSALGAGGWDRLTAADFGANGQILRGEYAHLRDFAQAIANGEVTEAQARARAKLYSGKAYSRFWAQDRDVQIAAGMEEERRVDAKGPHECDDCKDLAAQDWAPIGTYPDPGDGSTSCLGACQCIKVYRKKPVEHAEPPGESIWSKAKLAKGVTLEFDA